MADMTPAAWLELLDKRLTERWARWQILDDYYEGHHPLAFATSKFREAFGTLLRAQADNWCPLIVSSSVERLNVQGFRFGKEQKADDKAWAIWQANGMDAESDMAHTEAIKLGESYLLVAPPERGSEIPRITAEHPSQMIVACAAGDRRRRLAALKRWLGDDGYVYATLYLPDRLHKWRSQRKLDASGGWLGGKITWEPRDGGGRNPLRVVPVVPLCNNPTMLGGGQSDLAPAVPLFDSINKLCADLIIASEFQAYRQRIMTGVEVAKYPEGHALAGQPIPIDMSVTRLFTVEDENAKVFDLPAAELKNYIGAIEMFVQHLAAQTKTPPHYLLASMVNTSGDALTVAESGLHSKVEDKKVSFGEGHEEAMRLAFLAIDDRERASADDAETLWADSERRSFAQTVDGTVKLKELGVPQEMLWEELGWSPQKIARAKSMQLVDGLLVPPVTPVGSDAPVNGGGTGAPVTPVA